MVEFRQTRLENWLESYRQFVPDGVSLIPRAQDNLFHSMRWIGKEVCLCKRHEAWAMLHGSREVAWMSSYFLSPQVIRIRGLVTAPEFRRQGLMGELIEQFFQQTFVKKKKVLCFSIVAMIPYYERRGFKVESKFEPRPVELFNSEIGDYQADEKEKLVLTIREG